MLAETLNGSSTTVLEARVPPQLTQKTCPVQSISPQDEYQRRLAQRASSRVQLHRRERITGFSRLGVFLAGLALAGVAFGLNTVSPWWLLVPAVLFSALLVLHEQITRAYYRSGRSVAFYERGLARLGDDWKGKGQTGQRFLDESHPYAADLDLFGPGSLFELLCTARTRSGEETLAAWLLNPASPEEVLARQSAVAELRPLLDLREEIALLGADIGGGTDFSALVAWGNAAPILKSQWPRWVAMLLGAASLAAFGAFLLGYGPLPFAIAGSVAGLFALVFFARVQEVLRVVEKRARDLALLSNVLACLERVSFASPRLSELKAVLDAPSASGSKVPPSQRIARLGNLIDLLNSRRNMVVAPFAYLFLWGTQMAHALEAWRQESGTAVGKWLAVVGQFEALCALAGYAFENPDDPFPEVGSGPPCYDGDGLGHPLIPPRQCVRNDLHLTDGLRLLVVSGSNMSGKSTYLRTVGVNAVLALAGGPVRATRLRLTPLAIGATLRVEDSLQENRSRFFAEVLRIRQIVELSRGPMPLLFLLDELFSGTNSSDRRVGAEAVVRGLVERNAIGLITTHDLTLTQIADNLGDRAANIHFADHLENGMPSPDFHARPGVVQHGNALVLMRAVGLEV
jgi:hypothetical protein